MTTKGDIKNFLDQKVKQYNCMAFIENDPIQIPRAFSKTQDIEISGFIAAILSWGKRCVIIKKCKEIINIMYNNPYDFITNYQPSDIKDIVKFKHRTLNGIDMAYIIRFLNYYYLKHNSLEEAFAMYMKPTDTSIENGLVGFNNLFFSLENYPNRTLKHISTPIRKSACKRINMFLRWMVRDDSNGVDFGIWKKIKPHQLVCPCDVHVGRVAKKLELLQRNVIDWKAAIEITNNLKAFCAEDPIKYDFALFGLGVMENFK